ncbi:MAG TPA: hypothetical protein VG248_16075, partial [Caulobacteraceae bacterium]|nr:hypothetical protein [Caulobacteraceae bacterium]
MRFDRSGNPVAFLIAQSMEVISGWQLAAENHDQGGPFLDGAGDDDSPVDAQLWKSLASTEEAKVLVELVLNFRHSMESMRNAVSSIAILAPAMPSATFRSRTLPFARKNLHEVSKNNDLEIYALDLRGYLDILREVRVFRQVLGGQKALPSAIFLGLCASFDSFFAEIIKVFLRLRPDRFDYSSKSITLKELSRLSDISEAVGVFIDSEVSDIMRGSHAEQVKFVEDKLHITLTKTYSRWPEYIEIFERRNLAAHGNLIVNEIYLKNCRECPLIGAVTIGDKLPVTHEYIMGAI